MKHTIESVKSKIYEILRTLLNSSDETFELQELSSVQFIKLIVEIELTYDFEFEDDDLAAGRFKDIDEFAAFIVEKTNV